MATWLESDPAAPSLVNAMVDQRRRIGLPTPNYHVPSTEPVRVVPIIAVGPVALSKGATTRMYEVHRALQGVPPLSPLIDPLEIWLHDANGRRVSVTVPMTSCVEG